MITDKFYPKRALQMTKMIFLAQIAGSLAFMAVVYHLSADYFVFNADPSDPLFITLIFFFLVAIPAGYHFSRRKLSSIDASDSFASKYSTYQIALIIRLASCEGVALFAVACLFVTNNLFYAVFFLIALVIMILNYPSPEKIGREINLTQSEIELFY